MIRLSLGHQHLVKGIWPFLFFFPSYIFLPLINFILGHLLQKADIAMFLLFPFNHLSVSQDENVA
ncbi:hypothetical protein BDV27DRAFT_120707 [Aspergillus caelatus]|uniref:Uncharacterized protein n=1 Tax=Aspergillus caelatus TaxID=61420 RepID=A0A5N7AHZ1_9EURO|nr:uncharacterized protein BDV27DRAFT_120707 [Aspergillus caelatus]KAE8369482.1 hypothetical protein BDV27DRAFT_120707 [Aspergillus caelatus]